MKAKVKEIDIEVRLASFFSRETSENCVVSRQVYFGGKKIDLVLVSGDSVVSIEVKISDWKTALRQANLNLLASDYSFVAMWYEDAEKAIDHIDDFIKLKVGLIIIDKDSTPFFFYNPRPKLNNKLLGISRGCLMAMATA